MPPELYEALEDSTSHRQSSHRQFERKSHQFCRQVQRALNLSLADLNLGESISGLYADEVTPAPDCGHLLVHIIVPPHLSVAAAMEALRLHSASLRSEVAAAISRKRAPELFFLPAGETGDLYE